MAGTPHVEMYQAKDGWRWRARAANGKIVADGAEAYKTKAGLLRGLEVAFNALMSEEVEIKTKKA